MRKVWILAIAMLGLAFNSMAASIENGKQYTTAEQTLQNAPKVLEFFSFYCPHCYEFENVYHISSAVAASLPAGTTLVKYHVDFLGPLGKQLTHAWAVAMALGVEDKIEPAMFDAVQKTQTVQTVDDIRQVFLKAGVSAKDYDAAWNSFMVQSLVAKQEQAAQTLQLQGVPAMYISGKYSVRNEGLDTSSMDSYKADFVKTVKALLLVK